MTDFAVFLGEKVERYIELRRALGYAFNKQAGTLRAFVRHIERAELDAPATRTMALDFVLSFGGAANSRAVRHGVLPKPPGDDPPREVRRPPTAEPAQ